MGQDQQLGLTALQKENIIINLDLLRQGAFEDVLRFHRYQYYVLASPVWPDDLYDKAEALLKTSFPRSLVLLTVGSSLAADYPVYIREGRRPSITERQERDQKIKAAEELLA